MPLFFFAALLSFALDQASKIWIRHALPVGGSQPFLPGVMHLEHVQNYGAAWSILSGQKWLLVGFTSLVIVIIIRSAREVAAHGKLAAGSLGLILGGACGNLFDRIWFGQVTDFFDLDTPVHAIQTFPVFNVADSALTVGVIAMLLSLFLTRPPAPRASP